MGKKNLKDLTLKDNFMFSAVMMEEDNCRRFLEIALGFPINRVEVIKEKSVVYHPEYKGIRLDVYAKDENNTRYNVEMQVAKKKALEKRTRYYHGQIDMEMLVSGSGYDELPDAYVIFVCDFDPFEKGKYRYTFSRQCEEDSGLSLEDGCKTIFLSTKGTNPEEVPEELVKFLKFVQADLNQSEEDFDDEFVKKLQETIRKIKVSREMEERFMIFEEMLRDEREEGIREGKIKQTAELILDLLSENEEIPLDLKRKITEEKSLETLKKWHKLAAKADSPQEFMKQM